MDKTHYCAQFRTKKKWHAAAHAFTPPPLLWKMVGFLMVSVWNKTDIWAFISHKRTGKIRLENNNKCRNLERLKWRPFFFIPHSFGVPAAAASTKTTACTKLTFVSYTTRLKPKPFRRFCCLSNWTSHCTKTITFVHRPKMKWDAWVKCCLFTRKKTAFHSGVSLHFRASNKRYGFSNMGCH